MKKKDNNKNLDYLNKIRIAHRGLWNDENPENSVGSFRRCLDKGIPIELDVHILKDGTSHAEHYMVKIL